MIEIGESQERLYIFYILGASPLFYGGYFFWVYLDTVFTYDYI